MKCWKCGAEAEDGVKFCGICGETLTPQPAGHAEQNIELVKAIKDIGNRIFILTLSVFLLAALYIWNSYNQTVNGNILNVNCSIAADDNSLKPATVKMTKVEGNALLIELPNSYYTEEIIAMRNQLKWAVESQKNYASSEYQDLSVLWGGNAKFKYNKSHLCYIGHQSQGRTFVFYMNSKQAQSILKFLNCPYNAQ